MGKIKGFLFAVRHREILMTDLGLRKEKKYIEKDFSLNISYHNCPMKKELPYSNKMYCPTKLKMAEML